MATGYSHATACSALRPVVSSSNGATQWHHYRVLRLLLGYRNYYPIHRSPYTSAYILIENTLAQYKMAKNSHMALCYQNRVSKSTNQHCGLHIRTNISAHSPSVMVLGLLKKKKELVQNSILAIFRLAT